MKWKDLFKDGKLTIPDFYLEIAGKKFYLEVDVKKGAPSYAGEWVYCDATTYYMAVRIDEHKTSPRWFYTYFTVTGEIMEVLKDDKYNRIEQMMMSRLEHALTHNLKVVTK